MQPSESNDSVNLIALSILSNLRRAGPPNGCADITRSNDSDAGSTFLSVTAFNTAGQNLSPSSALLTTPMECHNLETNSSEEPTLRPCPGSDQLGIPRQPASNISLSRGSRCSLERGPNILEQTSLPSSRPTTLPPPSVGLRQSFDSSSTHLPLLNQNPEGDSHNPTHLAGGCHPDSESAYAYLPSSDEQERVLLTHTPFAHQLAEPSYQSVLAQPTDSMDRDVEDCHRPYRAVDPFQASIVQGVANASAPSLPRSTIKSSISSDVFAFFTSTLPRQLYLYALLRLPRLYFSRVTRIFHDAEMSLPDMRKLALSNMAERYGHLHKYRNMKVTTGHSEPGTYMELKANWEWFIDSLMREWKINNIVSVLLLSAILATLQIGGVSTEPLTRTSALMSLVCSLMSLLNGCMYTARFGPMRKPHKAIEWAEEAQKNRTSMFWNVWVFLAMPTVWLSWSLILYIVCIMAFVWLTGPDRDPVVHPSPAIALASRLVITALLTLGLVYLGLVINTLSRYGDTMDANWKKRVSSWIETNQTHYEPETQNESQTMNDPQLRSPTPLNSSPGLTRSGTTETTFINAMSAPWNFNIPLPTPRDTPVTNPQSLPYTYQIYTSGPPQSDELAVPIPGPPILQSFIYLDPRTSRYRHLPHPLTQWQPLTGLTQQSGSSLPSVPPLGRTAVYLSSVASAPELTSRDSKSWKERHSEDQDNPVLPLPPRGIFGPNEAPRDDATDDRSLAAVRPVDLGTQLNYIPEFLIRRSGPGLSLEIVYISVDSARYARAYFNGLLLPCIPWHSQQIQWQLLIQYPSPSIPLPEALPTPLPPLAAVPERPAFRTPTGELRALLLSDMGKIKHALLPVVLPGDNPFELDLVPVDGTPDDMPLQGMRIVELSIPTQQTTSILPFLTSRGITEKYWERFILETKLAWKNEHPALRLPHLSPEWTSLQQGPRRQDFIACLLHWWNILYFHPRNSEAVLCAEFTLGYDIPRLSVYLTSSFCDFGSAPWGMRIDVYRGFDPMFPFLICGANSVFGNTSTWDSGGDLLPAMRVPTSEGAPGSPEVPAPPRGRGMTQEWWDSFRNMLSQTPFKENETRPWEYSEDIPKPHVNLLQKPNYYLHCIGLEAVLCVEWPSAKYAIYITDFSGCPDPSERFHGLPGDVEAVSVYGASNRITFDAPGQLFVFSRRWRVSFK